MTAHADPHLRVSSLEQPIFLDAGDTALIVEFGRDIDRQASALVLALAERVRQARIAGVVETVPTFRSLMVHYDPVRLTAGELRGHLQPMLTGLVAGAQAGRRWLLPACYDPALAPDLAEVGERTGLGSDEVVRRHSATTYHVYMLGFLPGFPYMGDLPPELALPRRENPRVRVPKGAIAIAMRMSSIYTLESPGGWHLVARTPAPLWDQRREHAVLLAAGDKVQFEPVSLADYESLAARADSGAWAPEPLATCEGRR